MINTDSIKIVADNVITVVNNLNKEKNYKESIIPMIYLTVTGLMLNFGHEYVDAIYSSLRKVKFIEDDYYDLEMYFNTNSIDINYNIIYKNEGIRTLEEFIKSFLEIFSHSYNLNDDDKILSDVIKSLKTEDIVKSLYRIKDVEVNQSIKEALSIFDNIDIDNYHFDGSNAITNLFRPLFKFGFIKELFNKNIVDGDYRSIYEEFDTILGKDSFKCMITEIGDIKRLLNKKQVNTYNIACAYLNVRNNFVQSYISKKFVTA